MTKYQANKLISDLLNSAAAYRDSSESDESGRVSARTVQLHQVFNQKFLLVRNALLKVEVEE